MLAAILRSVTMTVPRLPGDGSGGSCPVLERRLNATRRGGPLLDRW
jgi:hypothetical protein